MTLTLTLSNGQQQKEMLSQSMIPCSSFTTTMTKTSRPIFINVSGLMYETRPETLFKYPNTLLGNKQKFSEFFCSQKNEYFFNRHRASFSSILFFYQSSGKLCRPVDVNLKVFLDECEFFELPDWAVNAMKRREGGFLEDEIVDFLQPKGEEMVNLKQKLWQFFDDPSSSTKAKHYAFFTVTLLFISIVVNIFKTVPEFRPQLPETHEHDGWEIADIIINLCFLTEFVLRLIVSPNKRIFFQSFLNWIDLIALVTFIPIMLKHYSHQSVVLFFTPFQLFRVIRIIRLAKLMPEYNVTEIILKDCMGYLRIFFTWLIVVAFVAATCLYNLEGSQPGSQFRSGPNCLWWAIQTFVTLGYGDIVPTTDWGKVFASVFIVAFIPTLCLPTLTILVRFSRFYEFAKLMFDD